VTDRILALPLVLAALASTVPGQAPAATAPSQSQAQGPSSAVLGKDNVAFARELYRAGYADFADSVCKLIEKATNPDPAEVVAVKAMHLDLRLEHATKEKDLVVRKDLIVAILKEKEEFIQKNPQSSEAEEARNTLPEVYQLLGETLTSAVEKEKDPDKATKLRTEGSDFFKRSEDGLKAKIALLQGSGTPELNSPEGRQLLATRYNLPRTYYFHSRLYPAGNAVKNELLEQAINLFQEFGLDYSETLLYYDSLIYQGLCQKDINKLDEAITSFDESIRLREAYNRKSEKAAWTLPPEALDIICRAVVQKITLLHEQKKPEDMKAAVKDLETTIENAYTVPRGLGVLGTLGDNLIAAGDAAGVKETIERLRNVHKQHHDPWAEWKARDLEARLAGGGGAEGGGASDAGATLRIAQTLFSQQKYDQAVRMCRVAIEAVRGTDKEVQISTDAWVLIGVTYATRGFLHEAAVAYDTLADKYAASELAPEALWRAATCYMNLNSREKVKKFYDKRMSDRINSLVTKYPKSEQALKAALFSAQQRQADGDLEGAYAEYMKVPPGGAGYEEAQYRGGSCLILIVRKLLGEKKANEAKAKAQLAETQLRKAIDLLDKKSEQTLSVQLQDQLKAMSFSARVSLANLFLSEGINREADIGKLFEGIEDKIGADAEKTAIVWGFRIQAMIAQGKVDEAVSLYETLKQKTDKSQAKRLNAAAKVLARALDQKAVELRKKSPKSSEAEDLWKRAAEFYVDSTRGDDSAKGVELEEVGSRLFVMGLHFAQVPDTQDTFIGWTGERRRGEKYWVDAAALLEGAIARSPSSKTMVKLGQVQAFLGKFKEAANTYAKLFDGESFTDSTTGRIDRAMLTAKPELLPAYLEWGVCERMAAVADKDSARFTRCLKIFENVCQTMDQKAKAWWTAKYHQINTFIDRGDYETANTAFKSVERTSDPEVMKTHGYKEAFAETKAILDKKVMK
jgi:tetratricopeptide (TPR) repeat protein